MTQAVAQILAEVEQLSPPERADLAEIERAQIEEVRRRVAQVSPAR